jgi:hypothetical protein
VRVDFVLKADTNSRTYRRRGERHDYDWVLRESTRVQRMAGGPSPVFVQTLIGLREALRHAGIGASSIIASAR